MPWMLGYEVTFNLQSWLKQFVYFIVFLVYRISDNLFYLNCFEKGSISIPIINKYQPNDIKCVFRIQSSIYDVAFLQR